MHFSLSPEYIVKLKSAIQTEDDAFILASLDGVNVADIIEIIEELSTSDCLYILKILDVSIASDILADIEEDNQETLLSSFTPLELAKFVDHMDSDDASNLLNLLKIKEQEEVIAHLTNEEKASYILDLLRYSEGCAGGMMAKELIKVNLNWDVIQCIDEIRRQAENVEKIYTLYVVDDSDKLIGRVSLKKIILSDDHTKIKDIYETKLISVETYIEEEEVVQTMTKYDLDVIPVINVRGTLVGRITVDDIIDLITETAEEERQLMSGISEDVEEDDSVWILSRARLPWLIIGMLGGMMGAKFIGLFSADIAAIPAMAFFIPLITATGGNVGLQSSSIVLQSLSNPSLIKDTLFKRLWKVFLVAVLNGLTLTALVLLINLMTGETNKIILTVTVALFSVVMLSSLLGTITPILLDKFGINPALASGPFITIANDLLGLGVYFGIAHLLFF